MNNQVNFIFSYFPLLTGMPNSIFGENVKEQVGEIMKNLEGLPDGSALGCIWAVEDDRTVKVIFIMDQAAEIAAHLIAWAEGEPEKWFTFNTFEKDVGYSVALVPNLKKTSGRWKIAFQLRYGFPPPSGDEQFLFQPLYFIAQSKTAFIQASKFFNGKVRVGLLDPSKIDRNNLQLDNDKVEWIGDFGMNTEQTEFASSWLERGVDAMLADQ